MKEILNRQKYHWDKTFENNPEMFGEESSMPARNAAELFDDEGKTTILDRRRSGTRHDFFCE